MRFHVWKLPMMLLIALAGVALIAGACGGGAEPTAAPAPKPTLKLVDLQSEQMWIENAIAKIIIESAYGYPVEEVVMTTPVSQVALAKGDVDVMMDTWPQYYLEWYNKETASGNIVDLGMIYKGPPQPWIVPRVIAEKYSIKTVEDLKRPEVVALFKDPENPSKGAFINCIVGWQCAEINRAKLEGYGLDKYYNAINPGSAGAMIAALVGPVKAGTPVFGYYWSPTSLLGLYDWYYIEEPAWTEGCWAEVSKGQFDKSYRPKQACAFSAEPITVTVHKSVPEKAPDVVELLRKMEFTVDSLNKVLGWAEVNDIQGKWDKAAVYYLKNYENVWTTWMSADKVEKVKEALARMGG
ncbi:MAG: hypothetical protein HY666_05875 [Chloroflexi bacterium]|nr:hypothetical protein [Chloroflexota bacterium]